MVKNLRFRLIITLLAFLVSSCADGNDTPPQSSQTDYSGTYCHGDFNKLIIDSQGGVETYSVIISDLGSSPVSATGVRNGDNIQLTASISGYDFNYDFTFSNDANIISGQINITDGETSFLWNEYGTKGNCSTIDVDAEGIPQFINTDYINVASDIENISLFRSSAGHDYSDSFESCRSMKHYYNPPLSKRTNDTVAIFSPINGEIVHLTTEEIDFVDDGVTNQKILIKSVDYPGLIIVLFHVDISDHSLVVGTDLVAGQQIGYARMVRATVGTSTSTDIAIHSNTPSGRKFLSYFDTMTDSLFSNYVVWGDRAITRSDFIISKVARDADPLTCSGETFTSSGSLPAYF